MLRGADTAALLKDSVVFAGADAVVSAAVALVPQQRLNDRIDLEFQHLGDF